MVTYSYVGSPITDPIYRKGTLGRAKEHLEATVRKLDSRLEQEGIGRAWTCVPQAMVTQASSAIPTFSLYVSLLMKVLRERDQTEGLGEQMARLFVEHLRPGHVPPVDEEGRIRLDQREMDKDVQAAVERLRHDLNTETLATLTDFNEYARVLQRVFGFAVPGIDYEEPVEIARFVETSHPKSL